MKAICLFLLLASERTKGIAEAEATKDLVQTKATEKTIDEAAESETAQETTDNAEDTVEKEADGGENLEERLGEETPERAELLLCVRHTLDLPLSVVDGLGHVSSELLEHLSKVVLLGRSLLGVGLVLGVPLDAAIGIHTADHTVGLSQDLATLLNQRLDVLNKILFVALLLGLTLLSVNLVGDHLEDGADLLERLLDSARQLTSKLPVLLSLLASLLLLLGLLLRLLRLLGDVSEEHDVADGLTLGVQNIAIVINLLAGADSSLALDELAHDITVIIEDVSLLGNLLASEGDKLYLLHAYFSINFRMINGLKTDLVYHLRYLISL